MITGATRVFALLGRPVHHSLSPRIYNALFAHHGLDAVYVALDVAPDRGAGLVEALRTLGLAGVNLTVPHKAVVVPALDAVEPAVTIAGAANVVVARAGRLVGANTDGEGFCRAFEERFGAMPTGPAAVLGAGGAARAVAAALVGRGVGRVAIFNRSLAGAEAAADHLARALPGAVLEPHPLTPTAFAALARDLTLVVNATAGGARASVEALPITELPPGAVWVDLNYWDPDPPALAACRARGLRVQEGIDMLVHQAALAFEAFTGLRGDPVLIRRHLG